MKKNLVLILISLFVMGCPAKKDGERGVVGRNSGVVGGGNVNAAVCSPSQSASTVGTIYEDTNAGLNNYGNFETRVKALLSATISPDEVGTISSGPADITGVRFQGTIKLDSSGKVVAAQTKMLIKVYDSLVANSQYAADGSKFEAIPIEFDKAIEGSFNLQTGKGQVLFRDGFGEILFEGQLDAQYFSGTVSFKNSVSVTGETPAQATLGQFYVARCAIIQ